MSRVTPGNTSGSGGGYEPPSAYQCPDYISTALSDSSAQNYALQFSGDNSGKHAIDDYFNNGQCSPCLPLTGPDGYDTSSTKGTCTSTPCYPNVFGQADAIGKSWHMYAESFGTASVSNCDTTNFSDGSTKMGYARKHAPSVFWTNPPGQTQATDCISNGNVTGLAVGDTGSDTAPPFSGFNGTESFSKLDFIVPTLCHDAHSPASNSCGGSSTSNVNESCGNVGGVGSSTTTSVSHTTTYPSGYSFSKHTVADFWLCQNLGGIERDVGIKGAVVILFDENPSTTGRIPVVVLPGDLIYPTSFGCGGLSTSVGACPLHVTGANDTTLYDQVSLFRTVVKTTIGGKLWNGSLSTGDCLYYFQDVVSAVNCARSTAIETGDSYPDMSTNVPVKLNDSPTPSIVQSATGAVTNSMSVTATFSAATTAGDTLIAVLGNNQGPNITAPTGWQLADAQRSAESIYYAPNAASTTSVTFTFDITGAAILQVFEVSALVGDFDVSAHATSGTGTGSTADSGTTDVLDSDQDQLVIGGWTNLGNHDAFTLDSASTPGFTLLSTVSQGNVLNQAVFYQLNSPEQSYDVKGDLSTADKWRGVIASFE